MFVETNIEVKVKDRAVIGLDEHALKLWMQRAFKGTSCYRISDFEKLDDRRLTATVAINTSELSDQERGTLEAHPDDTGALRSFVERMFEGKGVCRAVGDPKLRPG